MCSGGQGLWPKLVDERGDGVSSVTFEVTVREHAMKEHPVVRLPRTGASVEGAPLVEVLPPFLRRTRNVEELLS
jgi:hypothetical protein